MHKTLLFLFVFLNSLALAQTQRLTGKVTSLSDPEGLPGVSVIIKGTSQGTITNIGGDFSLDVEQGSIIEFSFIGYSTQQITYAGQTNLTIVLEEKQTSLNEVVVIGYTSIERRDITGSVYTVNSENLKGISVNGLDQALQGQAPGVQVTQSSGTPGGGVSVHIRGATSITASNTPLYIVDGMPVETGTLGVRTFGGQNDNALALLNPNDIESYTVLSDASAKALYGSRASNGVVLITTKRGKNSSAKITFDVQRGIIDPVKKLDMLNATQLLELQREAVTNADQNPDGFGLIPGVTDAVNTNWQDEVLRRAIMQQYQVAVTGGDDKTKYYISANFREEEGVQLNNEFQRFGTTINLDQKLTPKLSVATNISLSRSLNKRVKGDNFLDGVYSGAIKSLPYNVPYDENGFLVGPGSPLYAGFPNFNPVAQALLPRFNTITVKALGNINATYQFNPNLKLKAQASLDYNNVTEDQYESSQTAIGGFLPSVGGQGYGIFSASTFSNINSYITLSYNKELANKHKVSAVAGSELYFSNGIGGNLQGRLFPSDDFTYITSAAIVDAGSSFRSPYHSILSFFGEARYDFDERFLVTVNMRTDRSTNFGPNNKFGYFPAISAAWRISQEKFWNHTLINDLKVRASYGLTGNERIPSFTFLGKWESSSYNGSSGVKPSNVPNPDVKWETTHELNVGLDIGLWEGRVQSVINAYYNKTTDLLLSRPLPLTTGFTSIIDNVGELENKGLEFSVTTVNIDKQLRWSTTLNLSKNLNKVLLLPDSIPIFAGYTGEGIDRTNVVKEGEPLGTFWGLNFLGVNPATGDAIYEDRNKDGAITNTDAMVIGNSQPKLIGGITNTFQYKGFDLSIFFSFSYGNKVLNFTKASTINMGGDISSNQSVDALRRWQESGDVTDIPRYEYGSTLNNLHSNRLLEDASYLRLKNLSFGYSLPSGLVDKLMLGQLRIFASATNLWTLTKYSGSDPEVSTLDGSTTAQGIDFFTLPQVRTIAVGLNATLK